MKLTLEGIKDRSAWTGYHLPAFDVEKMCAVTKEEPVWLHFGSGNIFRAFLCSVAQRLLESGDMQQGITAAESHGTEIITECFRPHDNLSVAVTLNADGSIDKEVLASIGESLTTQYDLARIEEVFCKPSLTMVSFTITEKGYALRGADGELFDIIKDDMAAGPERCRHLMSMLAALCLKRFHACGTPLALVSMDNCSHNGEKLMNAVTGIAAAWKENGFIGEAELNYLCNDISYPWSMIDKITPRPDAKVEAKLVADGIDDIKPFVTPNGTYIAAFVNAERPQYLVIEDLFPNGRPPLEKAGVIFTDRDTVNKTEKMKVCTCLNPLHTALAIFGCLLGYDSIAAEMKDSELSALIRNMSAQEGMPVVVNPGILDPQAFLDEVLNERFPNPFMPDTPQRIATDTSQKLPIRYGEALKAHAAKGDTATLKYMPFVLAGWLRYLLAVDDEGNSFEPSSDPLLAECTAKLEGIVPGGEKVTAEDLKELLSNSTIFGVDLFETGLADKVTEYFNELNSGNGAVRAALRKITQS